jgi:hypothetical protein
MNKGKHQMVSKDERLAVLEVQVSDHEEDLKRIFEHQEVLSKGIASIDKTLNRIFWAVSGAAFLYVAQQVGVMELVQLILK